MSAYPAKIEIATADFIEKYVDRLPHTSIVTMQAMQQAFITGANFGMILVLQDLGILDRETR